MTLEELLAHAAADTVNAEWRSYAAGVRDDADALQQGRSHYAHICVDCGRTTRWLVDGRCRECSARE